MDFHCYILYSVSLNKFYVGSTSESIEFRLEQHNTGFYGDKKFTHKASDWQMYLSLECTSRKQAELIEKHIKAMKSSKYIENLRKYPEMQQRLLDKFAKV